MKFTLNTVTKCSGRLGLLSGLERLPNLTLETPAIICHTKGGSIPHLSKEATQYLANDPSAFLQVSISNTVHMQGALRTTFAEFIARKESATLLVFRDPSESLIPGVPEKESVPIFTRCGRRNIAVEDYMALVEAFRPDAYVPLYDADTEPGSSKKREQKSIDRTEKFVEQCLQWHRKSDVLRSSSIIGPVVGGYNPKLREKSVEFLRAAEIEFGGYLIDGLHLHGPTVQHLNGPAAVSIVTEVCKQLPEEKVRFCFGAFDPRLVVEMIIAGVDVFDTSYVFVKAAQEHRALIFSFDVKAPATTGTQQTELDTTDARWEEDFEPLLPGCTCHTCRKSTKAYLHHLYNTREMLGPILLMIHNMHHYTEFFKTIRHHVANDTLPQLLEHLIPQQSLPPYVPDKKDKKQAPLTEQLEKPIEEEDKNSKKQRA
ncbi:queuine tRNA-ribosyltransferase accessory subunit 2 [Anopheles ziemanni]|uniref:queuine tRNA-ribosyltransferase accessory subunit 2 n=1 Tax=Anopheles coustani TaxID=139045 RepID=UPI0026582EFE|nr:queuine tRNA-ribosyltransferase accessory subunit 2 [Anopheles coustani]XP_058178881.1 queuine tRNA-ribosyltransferase accessory subunit 2 [Anopheles ziemanni]